MTDFNKLYHAGAAAKDKVNSGRLLKAKFALFTSGMDALLGLQGIWRVSAPKLRASLSAQLIERICPVYLDFYRNYSIISFSKTHMNQYLKYAPNQVENALTHYFG